MSTTPISVTISTENLTDLDKVKGLATRSAIINQALKEYIKKSKGGKRN